MVSSVMVFPEIVYTKALRRPCWSDYTAGCKDALGEVDFGDIYLEQGLGLIRMRPLAL